MTTEILIGTFLFQSETRSNLPGKICEKIKKVTSKMLVYSLPRENEVMRLYSFIDSPRLLKRDICEDLPEYCLKVYSRICAMAAREQTRGRSTRNLDERSKNQQEGHAKRRASSPRNHNQKGFLGSI